MTSAERRTASLKGVCFDLDGTLIDTGPLHVEAEKQALATLGIPELAPDHPVTFGAGIVPGMQMLADHYGLPSAQYVLDAYLPAWVSSFDSGIKPMPGAEAALSLFHRLGVPAVLVTSGEDEYVEKILAMFEWSRYFRGQVTLESVENLKPHPEPYLKALELLGLEPHDCMGIEDSGSGLKALKAAGLYSVFVNSDTESLSVAGDADMAIGSLKQISDEVVQELFAL